MPSTAGDVDAPRWLSWHEAARYSSLSPSTLRRLARWGRLTLFKPTTRRTLIDRKQLDEVIAAGAVG